MRRRSTRLKPRWLTREYDRLIGWFAVVFYLTSAAECHNGNIINNTDFKRNLKRKSNWRIEKIVMSRSAVSDELTSRIILYSSVLIILVKKTVYHAGSALLLSVNLVCSASCFPVAI